MVGRKTGTQFQVLSQNIMSHGCTIELVYALKKKSRNNDKIFFSCLCARVHTHFSTPRVTWEIAPFFSKVNQDIEFPSLDKIFKNGEPLDPESFFSSGIPWCERGVHC